MVEFCSRRSGRRGGRNRGSRTKGGVRRAIKEWSRRRFGLSTKKSERICSGPKQEAEPESGGMKSRTIGMIGQSREAGTNSEPRFGGSKRDLGLHKIRNKPSCACAEAWQQGGKAFIHIYSTQLTRSTSWTLRREYILISVVSYRRLRLPSKVCSDPSFYKIGWRNQSLLPEFLPKSEMDMSMRVGVCATPYTIDRLVVAS